MKVSPREYSYSLVVTYHSGRLGVCISQKRGAILFFDEEVGITRQQDSRTENNPRLSWSFHFHSQSSEKRRVFVLKFEVVSGSSLFESDTNDHRPKLKLIVIRTTDL